MNSPKRTAKTAQSRETANQIKELEARIKYLEEVNRFVLEALDMAASVGDFHPNIKKHQEPPAILLDARSRIEQLISFSTIAFLLVDEADSDFCLADAAPEEMRSSIQAEVDFLIDNGTFGWVLKENRPVMIPSKDFTSHLILHVMATNSRIHGMFIGVLDQVKIDNIPDISLSLLSIVLQNTAGAIESFELYKVIHDMRTDLENKVKERTKQLEHHALHDPLTDLANRSMFLERMDYEIRASSRRNKLMALLMIDLDRFKEVNDSLGHHAGDELLIQFAERLRLLTRESDTVARLGGDEFGIFLSEIASPQGVLEVAQRILTSLDEPFPIEGEYVLLGASIGIAQVPSHGRDKDTIMRKADMAMYAAKRSGCGYAVFDPSHADNAGCFDLACELSKASDSEELFLCYQPKAEMRSGVIRGVEALLRWNNPNHGNVPPSQFIPIAEKGGLIKALTLHVIQMVLKQESIWKQAGIRMPVAVNLSLITLQDPELPSQIEAMLEQFHVAPGCIELEVTETAIMATANKGLKVIDRLSEMGIKLTIDNFGIGYSSLASLKKLPVQSLKIDRSFIENLDTNSKDADLVRSIIDLGHSLGLEVVAAGVETQEIWDRILPFRCDMAQGSFISNPLPAEELTAWLRQPTWPLDPSLRLDLTGFHS